MLFKKKIIQPGTYVVDRKDGGKQRVHVTAERISRWTDNFSTMLDNGLQVPAPWRHDEKAIPVRTERDESDIDAYNNAGFWKELTVEEDGALYGFVDVPVRTDYDKVRKTVTEVSPAIHEKWIDGVGNEYEDAITHIALVTHPVVPGQDNFEAVDQIALSLSDYVANEEATNLIQLFADGFSDYVTGATTGTMPHGMDNVQGGSSEVVTAIRALRECTDIDLPDDTSPDRLVEYLVVACRSAAKAQENQDDLLGAGMGSTRNPPKGSKEQTSQTLMSNQSYEDIAKDWTTKTGEQVTADDVETALATQFSRGSDTPEPQLTPQQIATLNFATEQISKSYVTRIEEVVKTGRVTPKYAEDVLAPMYESTDFSIGADGKPNAGPLDATLSAIESLPENSIGTGRNYNKMTRESAELFGKQTFSFSDAKEESHPDHPSNSPEGLSDEQVDDVVTTALSLAQVKAR